MRNESRLTQNLLAVAATLSGLSGLSLHGQGTTWRDPETGKLVAIVPNDNNGTLEELNFETDSSIVVDGFNTLACAAEALKEKKDLFLVISGYADGRGTAPHNLRLSQARADGVAEYLRLRGVDMTRVVAVGKGALPKDKSPFGKEINFINRKVVVTPHEGGFDGAVPEAITLKDDCGSGSKTVGTIVAKDSTYTISVDYAKVRADFRREVEVMLDNRKASDGNQNGPDGQDGTRQRADAASASEGAKAKQASSQPVAVPVADLIKNPTRDYQLGVYVSDGNNKANPHALQLDAAFLHYLNGNVGFQGGLQGDDSSFVHKEGVYGLLTMASGDHNDGFVVSVIGSYGWITGVPVTDEIPVVRTIIRAGARMGYSGDNWAFGAMYLTPLSQESNYTALPTATPTEPVNLAMVDLMYSGTRTKFYLAVDEFGHAIQNTIAYPTTGKFGGRAEFEYRFAHSALVLGVENEPIYKAYQNKAETRGYLGIRLGGRLLNPTTWVTMPTLRQGVAF